jgi:hypothetical protein
MGAIAINPKQTTIGGGVQRETLVTLLPGIVPTGVYWLGVKINKANLAIIRLTMGATDILALGRKTTIEADLNRAYPIPGPRPKEEWWGFAVPATLLPALYPNFTVYFSLPKKMLAVQTVPWNVIQEPTVGSGGFGSGVPEAQGQSVIGGPTHRKKQYQKKTTKRSRPARKRRRAH